MRKMVIVRVKRRSEDVNPAPVRPAEDEFTKDESQGLTQEEILSLQEQVASLRKKNNQISNMAKRIDTMCDDAFDPDAAVGLLQRIAVLDGMATVLVRKLVKAGFDKYLINTCQSIRENAERMYGDMKGRLSDACDRGNKIHNSQKRCDFLNCRFNSKEYCLQEKDGMHCDYRCAVNTLETILETQKFCGLCGNLACKNASTQDKSCDPIWNKIRLA